MSYRNMQNSLLKKHHDHHQAEAENVETFARLNGEIESLKQKIQGCSENNSSLGLEIEAEKLKKAQTQEMILKRVAEIEGKKSNMERHRQNIQVNKFALFKFSSWLIL